MLELSVHLHTTACPHLRAPGAPWPGCAKPTRPSDRTNAGTVENMPDNGIVESFNGSFRDECLNETLFSSLSEARSQITAWKEDYNRNRPHSSLGNLTPSEYAMKMALQKQAA